MWQCVRHTVLTSLHVLGYAIYNATLWNGYYLCSQFIYGKAEEFEWLIQAFVVNTWKIKDTNLSTLPPLPKLLNTLVIVIILRTKNEEDIEKQALTVALEWEMI